MPGRKAKPQMPATIDVRIPVSPDEHESLKARAKAVGANGLAAFFRGLAGLPTRKAGRPPKPKHARPAKPAPRPR